MTTLVESDPSVDAFEGESLIRYLGIYNADIDWGHHLLDLRNRLFRKYGETNGRIQMRQQIACSILLPMYDPSVITNPPENLLYRCGAYSQFGARQWIDEYIKIYLKDRQVDEFRKSLVDDLGIIHPIEYVPIARQAYRWLCERVEGSVEKELQSKAKKRMENLVFTYGGAAICSVFDKPEYSKKINKLPNWRSGYFFEKLLHEVYKKEELYKIKQVEMNRIDKNLVKKITR